MPARVLPAVSPCQLDFQAQLRAVFNEFDADGSGSVDTAEIQAMTAKLGMTFSTEEIEAMVRDADTNGNGVLEFDEFEQVIKAHLGKGASANGLGACRSRSRAC
jgi:Ca2+-binding EF-hand superfamily protein